MCDGSWWPGRETWRRTVWYLGSQEDAQSWEKAGRWIARRRQSRVMGPSHLISPGCCFLLCEGRRGDSHTSFSLNMMRFLRISKWGTLRVFWMECVRLPFKWTKPFKMYQTRSQLKEHCERVSGCSNQSFGDAFYLLPQFICGFRWGPTDRHIQSLEKFLQTPFLWAECSLEKSPLCFNPWYKELSQKQEATPLP